MSTAIDPIPIPASQAERALIAYLQQCLTGAWATGTFTLQSESDVQAGPAAGFNYYFSNDWKLRKLPLYEVLAISSAEMPAHSRNEDCEVTFTCEWKGNNEAGQTNPDANWRSINDQVGRLMASMSMSDDGGQTFKATAAAITAAGRNLATLDAVNHNDMTRFTCLNVIYRGAMRARIVDGSMIIMEKRNFTVRVAPENVD